MIPTWYDVFYCCGACRHYYPATNLNHEASPESPVLASPTLRPATVASRVEPQLLPTRAGLLENLTTTTVVTDCNIYTGRPRPTSAVAETGKTTVSVLPCKLEFLAKIGQSGDYKRDYNFLGQ